MWLGVENRLALGFGLMFVLCAQAAAQSFFPGFWDGGFNGNGRRVQNLGGDAVVKDVAIQADGRIVAAGYSHNGQNQDVTVVRYTANGGLDGSLNNSGIVRVSIAPNSDDYAQGVVIQPDGKIVVVGYSSLTGSPTAFVIARLNPDGTSDTGFGTGGIVQTTFGGNSAYIQGLILQTDGKIVVAGRINNGATGSDICLARYQPNGALDANFGINGDVPVPKGYLP